MQSLNNPVQILANVTAQAMYNNVFPQKKIWVHNSEATKELNLEQFRKIESYTPQSHPDFFNEKEIKPKNGEFIR